MTKLTTVLASLALVAAVGCSKKDDDKKAKNSPAKQTASKTTEGKQPGETPTKPHAKPEDKPEAAVDVSKIKRYSVDELVKAGDTVAVLDANSERTRKQHGKIPSATLLTHYAKYSLDELPKDKTKGLVFYCSNTQCGASKKGAKRALLAGYTNVGVLPVGVVGWKEAGQKTTAIQ